jgi:hypothetical protein
VKTFEHKAECFPYEIEDTQDQESENEVWCALDKLMEHLFKGPVRIAKIDSHGGKPIFHDPTSGCKWSLSLTKPAADFPTFLQTRPNSSGSI